MSFKEIRKGIKAFELMVFSLNDELEGDDHQLANIPLKQNLIIKALRLVNKTMSTELL